jgi:hypothetical protein
MDRAWWEGPTAFLCDYWWVILIVIVLAITAYFTRDYWLPLIGLV